MRKCYPGLQRLTPTLSEACKKHTLSQEPDVSSTRLTTCSSDISLPVSSPFQREHEKGDFPILHISGRTSFPALPLKSEWTAQLEKAF